MFAVEPGENLPLEAIRDAVSSSHVVRAHKATWAPPADRPNARHDLERITQAVAVAIIGAGDAAVGCPVVVPHATFAVTLKSALTAGEIRRLRRRWIKLFKDNAPDDEAAIADAFARFVMDQS